MRANTGVRPYKDCVFPLGNSAETWSRARQPQFNQWILKAFPLLVHGHEIDKYAPMCYNPPHSGDTKEIENYAHFDNIS